MPSNKIDNNYKRISSSLEAILPPGVAVIFQRREHSHTIIKIAGHSIRVQWVAAGWPAQIEEILKQATPDLVIAPHLSPGARELLNRRSIGWLDESGAAEFAFGTIVVSRTGIKQQKIPSSSERWSPALQATAEALLCRTTATVETIANVTGLSTGACTKTLRTLTDAGFLVTDAARGRYSSRKINDERKLLEAYAAAVSDSSRKNTPALTVGGAWRDLFEGLSTTGDRWNKLDVSWAVTGAAAAEVIAPIMTHIGSAVVYVDALTLVELEAIAKHAGLQPIEGGRLTLKPFPTTTSQNLSQNVDGVHVAPWPRIYADLRMSGVRGEDAAEHLWEAMNGR